MGNGLISWPKKMAQNLGSLAQNFMKKSTIFGIPFRCRNWKPSVAWIAFRGSNWWSNLMKFQVASGVGHLEGLVGSWRFYSMCGRLVWFHSIRSTSLIVYGELNHIIVASPHMFTPVDCLAWVNVGGECYKLPLDYRLGWTKYLF